MRNRVILSIFAILVLAGAAITAAALWDAQRSELIASFSTDMAPRDAQQRHNINRAASKIDGLLVRPGEEFSFNKAVGLRGLEQGYQRAPAIVDGEIRREWGGGVCQVSSTLYNAALLGNLKITERHAHSRKVSSVPPGRDATTAYGVADFKFVNTTGVAIRIRAITSPTRLVVSLYGKARQKVDVDITTQRVGRSISTYRTTRSIGGSSRQELMSCDEYR